MPRNDEIDHLLAPWSPAVRPPADSEGRRLWINERIFNQGSSPDRERSRHRPSHGSIRGTAERRPAPLLPIDE